MNDATKLKLLCHNLYTAEFDLHLIECEEKLFYYHPALFDFRDVSLGAVVRPLFDFCSNRKMKSDPGVYHKV